MSPCLLVSLSLFLIPLVYFYPVLLGKVVLAPGDGWAQNLGVRALAGQMLSDGQPPLWNPYIFGGMPLMASVVSGAFYPPNWLFAILPAGLAMNVVVITTYHLALVGTYLYARRIGIERIGALIAGVAFTFGGFMIAHLAHTSRIAAAAWLPWVLLAIENIARADSLRKMWRWTALGALFIALQFFAGEPQMMVFTALVAAPCAAFALWRCRDRQARARFVIAIAVMLLCGVLISLVELLPARELLQQSERSDPGPLFFDSYSFPPWQLPALIFPYFFGGAMLPPYRVDYWGVEIAAIMCGYVGMLTWLLAFAAFFARSRSASRFEVNATEAAATKVESDDRARAWLWLGVAVVSMLLAFGGYLPFELNHKLYRIPGYNSFRGLYRHQFEFTFAMAMLAGLGMSSLMRLSKDLARRAFIQSAIAMTLVVIAVGVLYRLLPKSLAGANSLPAGANSLTNPEFLVPITLFILSGAVLFIQIRNPQSAIRNLLLVAVLLLDVASYGHFFHWRIAEFDAQAKLADPPAVRLIKSRENDFNSFRVMSHVTLPYDYAGDWPEDPNFEAINQPNISILRGLQSVSGYDILRPARVGEIVGTAGAALKGFVQDPKSFGLDDRGLDLLNVKYLIVGNGGSTKKERWLDYDGIKFARTHFSVEFKPGVNLTTDPGGAAATEIAVVSTMANSTHLPDGAPVLKFRLRARDGRVIERELQAGRDTSEWAYDRADVKAAIKHQRARVVENLPAEGFDAHHYLGRLKFDRAEIEKIEWTYAREDASLYLIRASLRDETTGVSTPLSAYQFPVERWQKLARFDQVDVYENLRAPSRAWFVDQVVTLPHDNVLGAVRTGKTAAGVEFDPARVALLETEDDGGAIPKFSGAQSARAKITRYEPNWIELAASNQNDGFLVLSEIYYQGWEARVDGNPVKIYRTDYTLRGVQVPAGDHKVEFIYRPQSLRNGAMGAAVGVMILLLGAVICRIRPRNSPA
ncbi:MAG: YfhO family protein [Blastocatellales bacterium]